MKRIILIVLFTCACNFILAQVNIITTIAGKDTAYYSGDGGPATNATFVYPLCMCLDGLGNLYIVDAYESNNRIRKIVLSTGIITTVAGNGTCGISGDGGPATNALLCNTQGICTDTSGNIYFGDGALAYPRIRKIAVSTGIITTVAGNGIVGNAGDGGPATNAEFEYPTGLLMDKNGNFYISDINNNNVRKISPSGIISTIAGIGVAGYSGDGGPANHAEFNEPYGIGMDSYGNIIVTDVLNNCLRKIDAATNIITTICGNGSPGYTGNGGPADDATLNGPGGIFIDKNNNIYFSDVNNAVIREITAETRMIYTVAGCGVAGFSGDGGPATAAKMQPADVCLDSFGNMYIADVLNYRIREVYNPALGISQITKEEQEYKLFPNPNDGNFTLSQLIPDEQPVHAEIFDMIGRSIYQSSFQFNNGMNHLKLRNFAPGVYLLKLKDAQQREFKFKFAIE
jgi:hypothetical protein